MRWCTMASAFLGFDMELRDEDTLRYSAVGVSRETLHEVLIGRSARRTYPRLGLKGVWQLKLLPLRVGLQNDRSK